MGTLRLSVILATALVGLSSSLSARTWAQSVTIPEAQALQQSADTLRRNSEDPAAISDAYEQALRAYDALDDQRNALSILRDLYEVNYSYCEDDQAIVWAKAAIARLQQDPEQYGTYTEWVRTLGGFYSRTDRSEQAIATYRDGVDYIAGLQESATAAQGLWREEAILLRSQLGLSLDRNEAAGVEARLVQTRQAIGAIAQIEWLLDDAEFLRDAEYSPVGLLTMALQNSQEYRYRPGELSALIALGEAAIAVDDYRLAKRYGEQAMALAQSLSDSETAQRQVLVILAESQQGLGETEAAIAAYLDLLGRVAATDNASSSLQVRATVTELIALYQATGQSELANQLETDYADALSNRPVSTPLPLLRPPTAVPSVRRSASRVSRRCDRSLDTPPSLRTFPRLPALPRPVPSPVLPSPTR